MNRRAFLFVLLVACSKKPGEPQRCQHCGMKIDATSAWRAELIVNGATTSFDTPKCALTYWKTGKAQASSLRVQDYYDRKWLDATEIRFVTGGDVMGPMGPDFVPVDPARVTKYIQDHGAERAYKLDEITPEILAK